MTSTAELTLEAQLSQAGIPFEREYQFHPDRKWRADFHLLETADYYDLLVEIDGGAYVNGRHSRGTGVEADCEKTSAAAILGYRVIRATPKQVEDGRCLEWIRQALGIAADSPEPTEPGLATERQFTGDEWFDPQ